MIPCINSEKKYSDKERTKNDGQTNDIRKSVSFQPQVFKHTRSYAEAVKGGNEEVEDISMKCSLINFYPKVKK